MLLGFIYKILPIISF